MSQGGPNSSSGSGANNIETLTGNSGGAVSPDGAFNIDIVGNNAVGIDIVGTPGSNLLTIIGLSASETQVGTVELATAAETTTGTSTSLAVHPAGLNTKLGTQTSNGLIYGQGGAGTNLGVLAEAADGQLPIGSTGNPPTLATLTGGETASITNAAGSITIDASTNFEATGMHGWNGSIIETENTNVTSDGATITFSIEKDGGGDLTVVFSDGFDNWITAPDTVTLTAGTDISPTLNFVFYLQSTKTLTVSTVSFPATEHAPIATVLCQSAASVLADGPYKVHAWTDHVVDTTMEGHVIDISSWIRAQNATWIDGVVQTYTITPNGGAADNVILTTASGTVLQLHSHTFPAFGGTPDVYVVNDFTTAFTKVTDLNALLTDSNNVSMSGKFFSLVIWGVVSEDTSDSKLYCNLPSGSYNNQNALDADLDQFATFTIPAEFKGTGFLISEWKLRHQAAASGTWTSIDEGDLRGQLPSISVGGGAAVSSEFIDNAFRILDDGDTTKEIAFEASSITTANTRTITMVDADLDLANVVQASAALTDFLVVCGSGGDRGTQSIAGIGAAGEVLTSNGAAALPTFQAVSGDVTAGANLDDNAVVRGDGGAKGVQTSTVTISDNGEMVNASQPSFLAFLPSSDLNETGDGTTFLLGDTDVGTALTQVFDQNGDLTPGASGGALFTAPVTGIYLLNMQVELGEVGAAHTNMLMSINTSNRAYLSGICSPAALRSSSNILDVTFTAIADMDATDTATFSIAVFAGGKTVDIVGGAANNVTRISGALLF